MGNNWKRNFLVKQQRKKHEVGEFTVQTPFGRSRKIQNVITSWNSNIQVKKKFFEVLQLEFMGFLSLQEFLNHFSPTTSENVPQLKTGTSLKSMKAF